MTRLFCDRCGREIKTPRGHFAMQVKELDTNTVFYDIHEMCATCLNEWSDWYMLKCEEEFKRSLYHDSVEKKCGAVTIEWLADDE